MNLLQVASTSSLADIVVQAVSVDSKKSKRVEEPTAREALQQLSQRSIKAMPLKKFFILCSYTLCLQVTFAVAVKVVEEFNRNNYNQRARVSYLK